MAKRRQTRKRIVQRGGFIGKLINWILGKKDPELPASGPAVVASGPGPSIASSNTPAAPTVVPASSTGPIGAPQARQNNGQTGGKRKTRKSKKSRKQKKN